MKYNLSISDSLDNVLHTHTHINNEYRKIKKIRRNSIENSRYYEQRPNFI